MMELAPHEIHLWFAFPGEIQDNALLQAYRLLLTPEEEARQRHFRFERHRHQYLVSRALVRTTLSRYANFSPEQWRFTANSHGRPEIQSPARDAPLHFNLSHTEDLIVCAVGRMPCLGVDVEAEEGRKAKISLADRYFSPQEAKWLHCLPPDRRQAGFFSLWTLKEAYMKARGMGLSIPMDKFSFHLQDLEPLRIAFSPDLDDDPRLWRFWLLKPTGRHLAALAILSESPAPLRIACHKTAPLAETETFPCPIVNVTTQVV